MHRNLQSFGAEIILFNVTEIFPIDHLMGREIMNHNITPLIEDARAALERIAHNLKTDSDLKTSVAVIHGSPHTEICHAAQEMQADLVVLTTHGYTGLKHVWLGSTAERVVRHSRCTVLVVRDRNALGENQ
jgi:nucleotide-binding universal stress UspA family protein